MNGDGSADSPYEIATVSDIEYIRDSVNSGLSFDGVFLNLFPILHCRTAGLPSDAR